MVGNNIGIYHSGWYVVSCQWALAGTRGEMKHAILGQFKQGWLVLILMLCISATVFMLELQKDNNLFSLF